MLSQVEINTLPREVQIELFNYAAFLMQKYGKTQNQEKTSKWLTKVKRGASAGTSASETIETMREKERC